MRTTQSVARTHRLLALILAAVMVVVAPAGTAFAQESSDAQKAEAYYKKGVDAFFNKKYSLAITYFQRANALDPDPVVLYNISLAQSKLGNAGEALEASLKAKRMGGLPKDTALKNDIRITAYRRILKARQVCEAINPPATAEKSGSGKSGKSGKSVEADTGMSAVGWAGLSTAGVGAAALIGAGALNFVVSSNLDEYDTARADGDYGRASGLKNDIADRQSMGRVLLYSGAGLVAVGGALWAYDYFGASESNAASSERASVFGAVAPDGASVQVRWNF